MLQIGDTVRVRMYDEIPEHPIYMRSAESIRGRRYFGIPESTLGKFSGFGVMTVEEILPCNNVFTWYGATMESADKLTEAGECVYTLSDACSQLSIGGYYHYQFLENMLEPVPDELTDTEIEIGEDPLDAFLSI